MHEVGFEKVSVQCARENVQLVERYLKISPRTRPVNAVDRIFVNVNVPAPFNYSGRRRKKYRNRASATAELPGIEVVSRHLIVREQHIDNLKRYDERVGRRDFIGKQIIGKLSRGTSR